MRVLHVFAGPFPTSQGTQTLIAQTCRMMSDAGNDVHLLTYAHGNPHGDTSETTGFVHHRLRDMPRFRSERSGLHPAKALLDLSMMHRIDKLAGRLCPQLIHAHHYEALLAAAPTARSRKIPLVFHAHALMEPELGTYLPRLFAAPAAAAGALLDRLGPALAEATITLSEGMKACYTRRGLDPDRIIVAPPPADSVPEAWRCTRVDVEKGDPTRVVYSGNQDAYQGLDNLLAALSLLDPPTAEELRVEFHVSGETDGLERSLSARNLHFCSVRRLREGEEGAWGPLMNADLVIIPRSSPGGVPIKLVNALSAGKPVIADRRVAADLEHRREAFLVDARSPREISVAIGTLSRDLELRRRLSEGASVAASRLHCPKKYIERITELYTIACSSLQK